MQYEGMDWIHLTLDSQVACSWVNENGNTWNNAAFLGTPLCIIGPITGTSVPTVYGTSNAGWELGNRLDESVRSVVGRNIGMPEGRSENKFTWRIIS
jgi:hypothetical protein